MSRGAKKSSPCAVAAVCDPSSVDTVEQAFALCLPEYTLEFVSSTEQCLASLLAKHPSIILLDRFLGTTDSLAILRSVRSAGKTPVLFLSYERDEGSVVDALDSGADGYLTKPLRQMELVAYIKRLAREPGS